PVSSQPTRPPTSGSGAASTPPSSAMGSPVGSTASTLSTDPNWDCPTGSSVDCSAEEGCCREIRSSRSAPESFNPTRTSADELGKATDTCENDEKGNAEAHRCVEAFPSVIQEKRNARTDQDGDRGP